MINTTLTPKERIIKAKIKINELYPFYSYIIMNMYFLEEPTKKIERMCIDKSGNVFWNERFVNMLTDEQLRFILAHEASHLILDTFGRSENKNFELFNYASDMIINHILREDGFTPIHNILIPDHKGIFTITIKNKKHTIDINDKTAEDIYWWLDSIIPKNKRKKSDIDDLFGDFVIFDDHIKSDNMNNNNNNQGNPNPANNIDYSAYWKQKTLESLTLSKNAGSGDSYMQRLLGDILEPEIDWKTGLRKYVTNEIPFNFTMQRPAKHFNTTGIYTPSILKEGLNIIIGIDLSYSISAEEYNSFITECIGIATSYSQVNMRVIGWACSVNPNDDIELKNSNKQKILDLKLNGGGGTSLTCFTDYVNEKKYKSDLYIILTDGEIENTPKIPRGNIIFVLSKCGTEHIIKKYGKVLKLKNNKKQ